MEPVKELVKRVLPKLSSDTLEALLARLIELGVTSVEDLMDVEADDLKDLTLTLVQSRKLIRIFRAGKFFSCKHSECIHNRTTSLNTTIVI